MGLLKPGIDDLNKLLAPLGSYIHLNIVQIEAEYQARVQKKVGFPSCAQFWLRKKSGFELGLSSTYHPTFLPWTRVPGGQSSLPSPTPHWQGPVGRPLCTLPTTTYIYIYSHWLTVHHGASHSDCASQKLKVSEIMSRFRIQTI